MKRRGIPLRECETCHELCNERHRCLAARWQRDSRKQGMKKGTLFTNRIDQAHLDKQYEDLVRLKREVNEKTEKLNHLFQEKENNLEQQNEGMEQIETSEQKRLRLSGG
eukprot:GHVN01097741.1.p1 GENE.GHVN01097741.1~~GHVN01097741.1.p1  ORF type:complete len:109 (+),score=18.34 GHVN01097741.1:101-427(+)